MHPRDPRAPRATVLIPLALVVIAAGACTNAPAQSASASPPQQEVPSAELVTPVTPVTPAPATGEVPASVVEAARAELAKSVGADAAGAAEIVTAAAVDWPDSSLGCPQPDMMYLQVITPGYQVVLEVDGRQYDVRASTAGGVMLCEPGKVPAG
jgi:hypothetical protein